MRQLKKWLLLVMFCMALALPGSASMSESGVAESAKMLDFVSAFANLSLNDAELRAGVGLFERNSKAILAQPEQLRRFQENPLAMAMLYFWSREVRQALDVFRHMSPAVAASPGAVVLKALAMMEFGIAGAGEQWLAAYQTQPELAILLFVRNFSGLLVQPAIVLAESLKQMSKWQENPRIRRNIYNILQQAFLWQVKQDGARIRDFSALPGQLNDFIRRQQQTPLVKALNAAPLQVTYVLELVEQSQRWSLYGSLVFADGASAVDKKFLVSYPAGPIFVHLLSGGSVAVEFQ